ncbi:MAG TPA: DUF5915 domain-containing protein, partial [Gemmataceae bacterium]|nr:DUF5915 domain-containing protein [Gemmataceae bacterium]
GYELVAHRAVFVRFPLRGRPGENLLIWTTTPWTLTSNVAAAVNPQLKYLKVEHRDQVYYLAKGALTFQRLEEDFKRKNWMAGVPKLKTLEQIFKEKGGYKVLGELSGADMIGWTYDGPFDDWPPQRHPAGYPPDIATVTVNQGWASSKASREIHRVIAWEAVGETEGTGIVHIAPGCGKEDFLLGKAEGLVAVAPLDEYGSFLQGFGGLEGQSAVDPSTTDWILNDLQQRGILLAIEKYPHSYPHCWRCKTELLFRLVDEWFINMSWREAIMTICHDIRWIPDFGLQRELDWLKNMGDWMISKKRFWGLALPIWVCENCGHFDIVGSRDELNQRAVGGWKEFEGHSPHRPWIDLVKIKCGKCGGQASRIPDVGNPWLDAGIVPYSTLGYNRDRRYWNQWFPADFITECFPGQFRNWFYALLAMSTMMENRAPFKVLLGHGLVRDEHGEEMHKSKGNAIAFEAAADEGWVVVTKDGKREKKPPIGADLMRWLYCRHNPVNNLNFGSGPAEELRSKFTLKLWNTYAFFCNYARLDGFDPGAPQVPVQKRPDIDRWILSDLQLLIQTARREFERFNVQTFCLQAEQFVDDRLSNWYVRRNRRRFWKSEQSDDKLAAYQTLYTVLTTLTKLIAPIMPFLSEGMYQNLLASGERDGLPPGPGSSQKPAKKQEADGPRSPDSVHLCDFPQTDEALIDADLSADMEALLRIVSLGSAARNSVKIKVRQPLAEIKVQPGDERGRRALERFADQICEELNVKKVTVHSPVQGPLLHLELKPNMKTLGPKYGQRLKEVLTAIDTLSSSQAEKLQAGQSVELICHFGPVTLEAADVVVSLKAPDGWAGVADKGTQVLIDARITEELAYEGMARDVVRQVQELRKQAGLDMADRIVLYLGTESPKLKRALEIHKEYICTETLSTKWSAQPLSGDFHQTLVKVEGQPLTIQLGKMVNQTG